MRGAGGGVDDVVLHLREDEQRVAVAAPGEADVGGCRVRAVDLLARGDAHRVRPRRVDVAVDRRSVRDLSDRGERQGLAEGDLAEHSGVVPPEHGVAVIDRDVEAHDVALGEARGRHVGDETPAVRRLADDGVDVTAAVASDGVRVAAEGEGDGIRRVRVGVGDLDERGDVVRRPAQTEGVPIGDRGGGELIPCDVGDGVLGELHGAAEGVHRARLGRDRQAGGTAVGPLAVEVVVEQQRGAVVVPPRAHVAEAPHGHRVHRLGAGVELLEDVERLSGDVALADEVPLRDRADCDVELGDGVHEAEARELLQRRFHVRQVQRRHGGVELVADAGDRDVALEQAHHEVVVALQLRRRARAALGAVLVDEELDRVSDALRGVGLVEALVGRVECDVDELLAEDLEEARVAQLRVLSVVDDLVDDFPRLHRVAGASVGAVAVGEVRCHVVDVGADALGEDRLVGIRVRQLARGVVARGLAEEPRGDLAVPEQDVTEDPTVVLDGPIGERVRLGVGGDERTVGVVPGLWLHVVLRRDGVEVGGERRLAGARGDAGVARRADREGQRRLQRSRVVDDDRARGVSREQGVVDPEPGIRSVGGDEEAAELGAGGGRVVADDLDPAVGGRSARGHRDDGAALLDPDPDGRGGGPRVQARPHRDRGPLTGGEVIGQGEGGALAGGGAPGDPHRGCVAEADTFGNGLAFHRDGAAARCPRRQAPGLEVVEPDGVRTQVFLRGGCGGGGRGAEEEGDRGEDGAEALPASRAQAGRSHNAPLHFTDAPPDDGGARARGISMR